MIQTSKIQFPYGHILRNNKRSGIYTAITVVQLRKGRETVKKMSCCGGMGVSRTFASYLTNRINILIYIVKMNVKILFIIY